MRLLGSSLKDSYARKLFIDRELGIDMRTVHTRFIAAMQIILGEDCN